MALVTPIALSLNAFDALTSASFSFTVTGGDQVTKNRITIKKQSDGTTVYQNTVTSYAYSQTVPSGTLTNGTYYYFYFNTYNTNGDISANSNSIPFWCYSTPTLIWQNPPASHVTTSAYTFTYQYSQAESELLDFAVLYLTNSTGTIIAESGNLYNSATPPCNVSYTFSVLENNTTYKIKAICTTVNGTEVNSVISTFNTQYVQPEVYSSWNIEQKCDDGYTYLTSNILVAEGTSNPSPPDYSDGTKVYSTDTPEWIKWTSGFSIASNFLIKLFFGVGATTGEVFRIYGDSTNYISIEYKREYITSLTASKDYFTVNGFVGGTQVLYARSNYVDVQNNLSNMMFWVKKIGNVWTLTLTVISTSPTSVTWNGASTIEYGRMTDLSYSGESYPTSSETTQYFGSVDSIFPMTNVMVKNGVFEFMSITKDTTIAYDTMYPAWTYSTEIQCDFNNNINGGNTDLILSQISGMKIKRRKVGDFNWLTIYYKAISSLSDLNITYQDSFVPTNENYQWALVPIMSGGIEGTYLMGNTTTKLNGTFVSDGTTIFKLYNSVNYSNFQQNIEVGTLQPISSTYPIIIKNSQSNYVSGSVSAQLYGYGFEDNQTIDRQDVINQTTDFITFMTNGKAKIMTDWNGNIWLIRANGIPSVSYDNNYGNGVATVSFTFAEQGVFDNQENLYYNGLINTLS